MFKRIVLAASIAMVIGGCAQQQAPQTYSPSDLQREQQASYDRTRDGVAAMIASGELTPKQGAQRMATYVQTVSPQDYAIQDLWNYSVLVFSKQESGELSADEAGYLIQKKANEHEQSRQAGIDQYNNRQQQAATTSEVAPSFFLQGVGNAFQRAYSPPGQTQCTTTNVGGVRSTNCY